MLKFIDLFVCYPIQLQYQKLGIDWIKNLILCFKNEHLSTGKSENKQLNNFNFLKKNYFGYRFVGEGMDEDQFIESRNDLEMLELDYQEVQKETLFADDEPEEVEK